MKYSGFIRTKNFNMITIGNKKYAEPKEYAKIKEKSLQTIYNWIKEKRVTTRKLMDKTLIEL